MNNNLTGRQLRALRFAVEGLGYWDGMDWDGVAWDGMG